jgi:hypothetical protein
MCPLIYAKIITAPKSKIEKMKIKDVFGKKLFFLSHCTFYVNKNEAPYAL